MRAMITSKVRVKIEQMLRLKMSGLKVHEICQQLGMPLSTWKRISKRPEFRAREEELLAELAASSAPTIGRSLDEIQERIRSERPKTVEKLLALRDSPNARVALSAVCELIERDQDQPLPKASRTFQPGRPVERLSDAQMRRLIEESEQLVNTLNGKKVM